MVDNRIGFGHKIFRDILTEVHDVGFEHAPARGAVDDAER